MSGLSLAVTGTTAFLGVGVVAVEKVANQGPDLAGIALVITAITGLIGTVGALVLGFRKKSTSTDALLEAFLERETRRLNLPEDPP